MPGSRLRCAVQTVLALVVFASACALIRIALLEGSPITIASIRFVLASTVMIPLVFTRGRGHVTTISKSDLSVFRILAVVEIVVLNVLQNVGIEYTTVGIIQLGK